MSMKEIYQMTKEEVLRNRHASEDGLTESEVLKIRQEMGENCMKEAKKKSPVRIFAEQFLDLLVIILIIAAVVSMLSGNVESTVVIFVVIVMNAVLGTVQYLKAEKSLDSLKALSSPHAKVLREGKKMEIVSKDVVPGDILLLEAGDMIAADGRILDNYSLQVNESSLTGCIVTGNQSLVRIDDWIIDQCQSFDVLYDSCHKMVSLFTQSIFCRSIGKYIFSIFT